MAIDLDAFIKAEKIGFLHNFGDTMTISKNDLKSLNKSKIEGKYVAHVDNGGQDEVLDYLTAKDLMALRDDKNIKCTWVRSKSGKPYWNHSSQYEEEEL